MIAFPRSWLLTATAPEDAAAGRNLVQVPFVLGQENTPFVPCPINTPARLSRVTVSRLSGQSEVAPLAEGNIAADHRATKITGVGVIQYARPPGCSPGDCTFRSSAANGLPHAVRSSAVGARLL